MELSVENDYHKLKHTISLIKGVVDAEKLDNEDGEVRDLLEKLKDIVCDADDSLDDLFTYDLRNERANKVLIFFSLSNQLLFRHKLSGKVESISERLIRLDNLFIYYINKRKQINLRSDPDWPSDREEGIIAHRERHPSVGDERFIGRDYDKMKIIELLMESDIRKNVSVVAIVGRGGMGKTELAKSIYNDKQVLKHFELRIWVSVSSLHVRQIAEKIIEMTTGSNPKTLSLDALQSHLGREFDGKKYLIVLDDVWHAENVTNLLMGGAKGSKVLVTTRIPLVAQHVGANPPYFLSRLNWEDSWSLFKKTAFKQGEGLDNPRLVEIGLEFIPQFVGNPLALTVLGSLLSDKGTEMEWWEFKENYETKVRYDGVNRTFSVLKLSYDYLPTCLKQCFGLCSIYPKNHVIDKQKLVQLWRAHEFIPFSDENRSLEDVGDSYFKTLERRFFFKDVERDQNSDTIISFKLHDLMHDLAEFVSGTKESVNHLFGKDLERRIHHVAFNSFQDSSSENPSSLYRNDNIGTRLISYPYPQNFFSIFRSLRSLDMHNLRMKMVPSCVGKMKYLRYLDLSENDIKTLPNSVTKLQNLQTLKLSECYHLEEFPEDIGELVSLRHLELELCNNLNGMPFGLGHLTSLHTLPLFITGPGSRLSELKGLNHLRDKLKIELRSSESEVEDGILKEKSHLKSLELNLRHCDIHLLIPNLVTITLLSCYGWKHLPHLGKIPSLQSLELSSVTSLRYIEENSNSSGGEDESSSVPSSSKGGGESRTTFFPSLKYLSLVDLPNLKGWWNREEPTITETATEQQQLVSLPLLPSFPCLSRSYLRNCPKLESMPLQPSSVELKLDGVSAKLVQQQLSMANPAIDVLAPSSSSSCPFPRLEILYINDIEDLVSLPAEAFQCLTSLWKLWICNCRTLTSLPRGMQYLVALKSLRIHNCQELDLLDADDDDDDDNGGGGIPFLGLKNLTSLELSQIPKLVSLPAGIQHLTSLQSLSISGCENLITLEQIDKLTSLEQLSVSLCPRLMLLPKRMHMLAALQQLKIEKCSKVLYERYNKDTGKYWPRIERIPDVLVKE